MRAPTGDDRRDPKKSERERGTPLFRDEINKRKKKGHTHFVGQAPERSDCRFRVSEILKKKNVGENAGGVQVGEKELTVAKVANRETEQFDEDIIQQQMQIRNFDILPSLKGL